MVDELKDVMDSSALKLMKLLQLSDSAYPIGAYAHSNGCESNYQLNLINGKGGLEVYTRKCIENEAHHKLPFVREAYLNADNSQRIKYLDQCLDVTLSNHVTNRASSQLGRAALEASKLSFQLPSAEKMLSSIDSSEIAGHYPIVYGLVSSHINVSLTETLTSYIFGYVRDVTSAAVRLDVISCMEALELQRDVWDFALEKIRESMKIPIEETVLLHPIVDLATNAHTRLYSRLFQS